MRTPVAAGAYLSSLLDPETLFAIDSCDPAALPVVLAALATLQGRAVARLATAPPVSPAPSALETYLDVRSAAARLGLSPDWLYRHAARLPFTRRVGRRTLRFDPVALDRWMASRAR